jgi:probable O-glycosylation ligase (exosortase A-associated)
VPRDATTILLLIFLVAISISTYFAMAPAADADGKYSLVFKTFFFLLVIRALLTDAQRIHALIWMMVITLAFYGIKGGAFAIHAGGEYRVYGPPSSMISDNNNLAVGLLVCLPLMNYLRLRSPHRVVRVGLLGTMSLTLLGIVATYSRGALLGLLAVATVMWWRGRNKAISAFVLVFALTAAFAFMPASWTARMDTIIHYQGDSSAEDRLQIWGVAIKLALAHPLTGSGFMGPYTQSVVDTVDPTATARSTHDIFLEVLSENGFPAFFVWLGMVIMGLINSFRLIRLARGRPELQWVQDLGRMSQVAIVAYLVGGTFLPLSYWDYFFTLLIILEATREVVAARLPAAEAAGRLWRPAPSIGVARPPAGGLVRGRVGSPPPLR